MGDIKNVLVIGGTGMLGKPVAERLAAEGFQVSIGSRSTDKVFREFNEGFKAVALDITDLESVEKALAGQDAVHLNLPSGPKFKDCFKNEFRGAKTFAAAAKNSNLKRVSYISGANVNEEQTFPPSRAKWLAEEAIRGSGVPYTIWRPSWFMETLTKSVRPGSIGMIGNGEMEASWLCADDLGGWIAKALRDERAANKVFWAFGPEKISYRQAVTTFRDICHPKKKILKMPAWMVAAMGKIMGKPEMTFGAKMFKFLENDGERGDATEAIELFGEMPTTVRKFCEKLNNS